jgi:hypothetical protein
MIAKDGARTIFGNQFCNRVRKSEPDSENPSVAAMASSPRSVGDPGPHPEDLDRPR